MPSTAWAIAHSLGKLTESCVSGMHVMFLGGLPTSSQ